MLKFYSEVPDCPDPRVARRPRRPGCGSRSGRSSALRIHDAISGFAEAGRVLQGGGENIQAAGAQLGDALAGLPLVGAGIDDLATGAFADRR